MLDAVSCSHLLHPTSIHMSHMRHANEPDTVPEIWTGHKRTNATFFLRAGKGGGRITTPSSQYMLPAVALFLVTLAPACKALRLKYLAYTTDTLLILVVGLPYQGWPRATHHAHSLTLSSARRHFFHLRNQHYWLCEVSR